MKTRYWLAGLAVLAATASTPVRAHAQDEGGAGLLSRLQYCASGGLMAGVGRQGRQLWRGPYAAFNMHRRTSLGMELGVEAAYAASDDILRTTFVSLGGIARLSPVPEDYRAYVQLSLGWSRIGFEPKVAGLEDPGTKTRPGGSIGAGFEAIQTTNLSIGGLLTYNGVVIGSNSARSFLVVALTVTFKPSQY